MIKHTQVRQAVRQFLVGFSMGAADIVPGVSGGTVAFVAGIYEPLLDAVETMTSKVPKLLIKGDVVGAIKKTPFGFLVPLAVGVLSAIFLLSHSLEYLLEHQPVFVWSFFFGLVGASIFLVRKSVSTWSAKNYLLAGLGAIATYILVTALPVTTPATPIAFFLSGMVAICAMILPGISGSFLLVLMGKYEQVLSAVSSRDFLTILYVGLGAVVGIIIFSKLLKFLLKKYHDATIATLTGVLVGSLRKVWPWKETLLNKNILPDFSLETVGALVLLLLGVLVVIGLTRLDKRSSLS